MPEGGRHAFRPGCLTEQQADRFALPSLPKGVVEGAPLVVPGRGGPAVVAVERVLGDGLADRAVAPLAALFFATRAGGSVYRERREGLLRAIVARDVAMGGAANPASGRTGAAPIPGVRRMIPTAAQTGPPDPSPA